MKMPTFKTREEKFKYLKENKEDLIYAKKAIFKMADGFGYVQVVRKKGFSVDKSDAGTPDDTSINVVAIINTTYVKDSHDDVHIDGLWDKTLAENGHRMKHLQEHKMAFDKIISDKDDLTPSVKTFNWKELGIDAEGKTQALVFNSTVREERNKYMYGQYKDGHVDNHSVGMRYVKLALAIDETDDYYKEEKAEFDKHIDKILNKEQVLKDGYFWAIYEAKAFEGSAVPAGSNPITPTTSVKTRVEETDKELEAFKQFLNIKGAD